MFGYYIKENDLSLDVASFFRIRVWLISR